jgi:hypothetical protein
MGGGAGGKIKIRVERLPVMASILKKVKILKYYIIHVNSRFIDTWVILG